MSVIDENTENAFSDEYARMKHDGYDALMSMRLDKLLYQVYRRGYIRGHSDRSREVQQEHRDSVDVRYEGDRVVIEGRAISPPR